MSATDDFDRIAAAWLAEGPTELADRVFDDTLAEIHHTAQRTRIVRWRRRPQDWIALAAALTVITVVGLGAVLLRPPTSGPAPSTIPTKVPGSPSANPSGSSEAFGPAPAALQGIWQSAANGGKTLIVRQTDALFCGPDPCAGTHPGDSKIDVQGDEIKFFGISGTDRTVYCGGGDYSRYRWSITSEQLTFEALVEDTCPFRSDTLLGHAFTFTGPAPT